MKKFALCFSIILGFWGWAADAGQPPAAGNQLKCSAYLVAQITQITKTAEGLTKEPVLLADDEAILKYLATVQAELNGDFPDPHYPEQNFPNQKRWEHFFGDLFQDLTKQVEKNFVVFTGDNYPNPVGFGSLIGLKNYIFGHPSIVLPIKVIAPAWANQVLHWANHMAFAAKGAVVYEVGQLRYIAYILDQLLPNFILQTRDYEPQVALAHEVFHKLVDNSLAMEAGLPQVLLRKIELGYLLSFTKNFALITATWQSYVEQNYQNPEAYASYGYALDNLYYYLGEHLTDLDYGNFDAATAWAKFLQKYMPADLTKRPANAEINKVMLYTIWHGRYGDQATEFDSIRPILHQSLMENLKGQIKALHQRNADPAVLQAWTNDLYFIFLGARPPRDDDIVPVFYQASESQVLRDWQLAAETFYQAFPPLPNFLPLIASEVRWQDASKLMRYYHHDVETYAVDAEDNFFLTNGREEILARAATTVGKVLALLGPNLGEDFLEEYLATHLRLFSNPFIDAKALWMAREEMAAVIQLINDRSEESLKNVVVRSLLGFLEELNTNETKLLGLGDFVRPGEPEFSFMKLVQEVYPPRLIKQYFYARILHDFIDKVEKQMQRMPQSFTNEQILETQGVLLNLLDPQAPFLKENGPEEEEK